VKNRKAVRRTLAREAHEESRSLASLGMTMLKASPGIDSPSKQPKEERIMNKHSESLRVAGAAQKVRQ